MKTYKDKIPIWIVGSPKSGTSWIARLLGESLDSPVGGSWGPIIKKYKTPPSKEGDDRVGPYYIIHDHLTKRPDEGQVVYIYRDPRDVIVSAFHYWSQESISYMIDCIANGVWPYNYRWKAFMEYWYLLGNSDVVLSYEELHRNTKGTLRGVIDELGISCSDNMIDQSIENQEFNAKREYVKQHGREMPYGMSGQLAMLRKGIVGDWKEHLRREDAYKIHCEFYNWMEYLKYETDSAWWQTLPAGPKPITSRELSIAIFHAAQNEIKRVLSIPRTEDALMSVIMDLRKFIKIKFSNLSEKDQRRYMDIATEILKEK